MVVSALRRGAFVECLFLRHRVHEGQESARETEAAHHGQHEAPSTAPLSLIRKPITLLMHAVSHRYHELPQGVWWVERKRNLLTINKSPKVGKYNALSGNTAAGHSRPSIGNQRYATTLRLAL